MNYKRKRPKQHTFFTCGVRCEQDRMKLVGYNHPYLYKISDRVRLQGAAEQIKEYKLR